MNFEALCFVDMPFGRSPISKDGVVVGFDQGYNVRSLQLSPSPSSRRETANTRAGSHT